MSASGATVDPNLLTAAERIQYEGYLRREDANAAILVRAKNGASIKQIVRETGHRRRLVRRILRGHVRTYSERAKVLWSRICPVSTRNRPRVFTAVPSFGGV
ncbi:MAG: hypothetical protein ACR65W_06275 [Methylocystis sp.]|uniref:hypothetical protein n=1 Tax=Methylocystis sp. TaxID=1911079 RepID=UPI003DA5F936